MGDLFVVHKSCPASSNDTVHFRCVEFVVAVQLDHILQMFATCPTIRVVKEDLIWKMWTNVIIVLQVLKFSGSDSDLILDGILNALMVISMSNKYYKHHLGK